jgi:proton glutamate symport protein
MEISVFVNYPALTVILTRGRVNPWRWYQQCLEACLVGFSLASSAATLPVSIRVVQRGDQIHVPESLAKFVLSLGATVGMDASACCKVTPTPNH